MSIQAAVRNGAIRWKGKSLGDLSRPELYQIIQDLQNDLAEARNENVRVALNSYLTTLSV